ncbi:MFS transporter [Piscinibacter koreensis]|uniref:MFS transporter n=1 Tax=Piscinibacter koreensis TaxID=2742824 RepID=A0A7Y6NKC7_9BURK|nr:MFS transporter [Schlegelella koreensis]NUZ04810.1 MFS transporter [Schlegelella koreensis]
MPSEAFSLRRIAVPAFGPSLLFGIGDGAILPIVALSARQLGASVSLAALIVTLIGIGSMLSNIPASLLTTRYGERRAIIGAAIWGALGMALCIVVAHVVALAVGVFMVGMASAVFGLARQSYLTEAVPIAMRARALSTLGGVLRIGLFIGPFIAAGAIHAVGIAGAYGVGIVALVAAAWLALRMPDLEAPEPVRVAPPQGDPTKPLAAAPPTLRGMTTHYRSLFLTVGIGVMLVMAVRASRQVVIPLWADAVGLDAATTSMIYGLSSAIDMLVFYPAGKVMDQRGRVIVAVPSMLIMGVGLALMPFTHGTATLLVAALLIGFGNGIGSGLVMTLGADYSPSPGRAHFLGIWRLLADVGLALGPMLLSAVSAAASLAAGIWSTALLSFAAAAVLGYWIPITNRRWIRR